jgi:hypothetical protein
MQYNASNKVIKTKYSITIFKIQHHMTKTINETIKMNKEKVQTNQSINCCNAVEAKLIVIR